MEPTVYKEQDNHMDDLVDALSDLSTQPNHARSLFLAFLERECGAIIQRDAYKECFFTHVCLFDYDMTVIEDDTENADERFINLFEGHLSLDMINAYVIGYITDADLWCHDPIWFHETIDEYGRVRLHPSNFEEKEYGDIWKVWIEDKLARR